MKRSRKWLALFLTAIMGVASLLLLGCELDSADSVVREVGINYSGFYVGNDGDLVSQQTGAKTTSLNLRQTGDQLEAVDNNGITFRGTIGTVVDDTASFVLDGATTAGQSVTIDGTLTASGAEGTMRGTWIEPALSGTVSGKAVINPVQTNDPVGSVTLVAGSSSISVGSAVALTASGASSYNWSSSGATGTFADGNGTDGNNSWTGTGTGIVTITATDATGSAGSDSVTVAVN